MKFQFIVGLAAALVWPCGARAQNAVPTFPATPTKVPVAQTVRGVTISLDDLQIIMADEERSMFLLEISAQSEAPDAQVEPPRKLASSLRQAIYFDAEGSALKGDLGYNSERHSLRLARVGRGESAPSRNIQTAFAPRARGTRAESGAFTNDVRWATRRNQRQGRA